GRNCGKRSRADATKADFPIPEGPTMTTSWGRPCSASSAAATRAWISGARPTNALAVSPRRSPGVPVTSIPPPRSNAVLPHHCPYMVTKHLVNRQRQHHTIRDQQNWRDCVSSDQSQTWTPPSGVPKQSRIKREGFGGSER